MATGGLYGSSGTGALIAQPGSESSGLYGNTTNFGGTYFEWFIFQVADLQPATPTGGSWNFTNNTNTPPTGWSSTPPANPLNTVWVSIAIVNSKNTAPLVWSVPGKFAYSSGLPILSGNGTPSSGLGQSDQLYIQLDSTPQTIWFKESGTWTRLTGSSLYVDLTSNQTIAGTKTFSSQIQGSISGTASNVTGIVAVANGGTSSTNAADARLALGAAASGANSDITSLSGITGGISSPDFVQFDTGATVTNATGRLYWDNDQKTLSVGLTNDIAADIGQTLYAYATNAESVTITKGQPVYMFGASGDRVSVKLANNTTDTTSAKTLGICAENIAAGQAGMILCQGVQDGLNLAAYSPGDTLYLGATAGTLTNVKPYAPNHLVYIGVVERANAGNGRLYVRVQNGYELDELHNVAAQSPTNGQTIVYNSSTNLWEKNTVSLAIGVNGTLPILNGGTGQTTANAAFNALAPSQTGNSGRYLTTDGTNTSWAVNPLGTVTSVAATVPAFLSITGSPITTSGTLAIGLSGTALPTANGGTGLTSFTANGVVYASTANALTTGSALTFDGSNLRSAGGFVFGGTNSYLYEGASDRVSLRVGADGPFMILGQDLGSNVSVLGNASGSVAFYASNSEQMRLTSTGLGIGTSSPAYRLTTSFAAGTQLSSTRMRGAVLGANYTRSENSEFVGRQVSTGVTGYAAFVQSEDAALNPTFLALNPSGGNVGIGLSAPTVALDVAGNGLFTNAIYASVAVNSGTVQTQFAANAGSGLDIRVVSNHVMNFFTNNTERMRLDTVGNLGLGATPSAGTSFINAKTVTGATTAYGNRTVTTIQSDVTSAALIYDSLPSTQAASFALGSLQHYRAAGGTIGAGSSVGLQIGFNAESSLTGAGTNVGFYGNLAAASGRWNFYANGTADNYFAGNVLVGTTSALGKLVVNGNLGVVTINADGDQVGFSKNGFNYITASGAAATLQIQATGAAGVMTFGTAGSERMRITSAGNVGIGTSSPAQRLDVGNGNISFGANLFSGAGVSTGDVAFEVGGNRTGSGNVYIDLHAVNGGDFQSRILRSGGANGSLQIVNTGTGDLRFQQGGAAPIIFDTSSTERMRIDSSGNLIQSAPTTPPSLATDNQMVFNLTSNTNLRVSVRGSDGVTRTANITLA